MKSQYLLAIAFSAAISTAALAAAPTTQPLIPVDQIPVPQSRTPAPAPLAASVLVFNFAPIGNATSVSWVGHAVQENLIATLSRSAGLHPTAASTPLSDAQAIARAKTLGADAVIVGSFQAVGADMRFTGQVLSVATGRPLGGLKSSGNFRDLFSIEDDLAQQAKDILRPPTLSEALSLADQKAQIFNGADIGITGDALNESLEVAPQFESDYDRYYRTPAYYDYGGYGGWGFSDYDNYPLQYYSQPTLGFGFPIIFNRIHRIIIIRHGGGGVVVPPGPPKGHTFSPGWPPPPGHFNPL